MRTTLALAVLFALTARAAEQPLSLVSSGFLLDGSDRPLNDPAVSMAFRILDKNAPVFDETKVWEGACTVKVTHGLFAVALGTECGTGLDTGALPAGSLRWLEIAVNGDALLPRMRLSAVPVAVVAHNALKVGGRSLEELDDRYARLHATPGAAQAGGLDLTGEVSAGSLRAGAITASGTISGNGSGLTNLDASKLVGVVPSSSLPAGIVTTGADASLANIAASGTITGNGSGLTNLDASKLVGQVPAASLPAGIVTAGANGTLGNVTVGTLAATGTITGNGSGLTNLDASKLTTGLLPDGRLGGTYSAPITLSGNVTLGGTTTTVAGLLKADGGVKLGGGQGTCDATREGTLRYAGGALSVCTAAGWTSLATAFPKSCLAAKQSSTNAGDGPYWIDPDGAGPNQPFQVWCDMSTDGGGWTLAMRVFSGAQNQYDTGALNTADLAAVGSIARVAKLSDADYNAINPDEVWNVCAGGQSIYKRNKSVAWYSNHGVAQSCGYNRNFWTHGKASFASTYQALSGSSGNQACGGAAIPASGGWGVLSGIYAADGSNLGCYSGSVTSAAESRYATAGAASNWNLSGYVLIR